MKNGMLELNERRLNSFFRELTENQKEIREKGIKGINLYFWERALKKKVVIKFVDNVMIEKIDIEK